MSFRVIQAHKKIRLYQPRRRNKTFAVGIISSVLFLIGIFFITRGTDPFVSELAFTEYSSYNQNVGSILPASCESDYEHTAGECACYGNTTCGECNNAACPDDGSWCEPPNVWIPDLQICSAAGPGCPEGTYPDEETGECVSDTPAPSCETYTYAHSSTSGCTQTNWNNYETYCDGELTESSYNQDITTENICTCTNGYTNYPTCGPEEEEDTPSCTNGYTNYPTCGPVEEPKSCTNGYTNYPTCGPEEDTGSDVKSCTNGYTNYPTCGPESGCGAGTLNDTCPATCNDTSADNYGQVGSCTYTPSGCGPGTLNDTCPIPVIRDTAVVYPNVTFVCDESDSYSVTYNDAYPRPQVIQNGPTVSGDTVTSLLAGEGNYRLTCMNPYGSDFRVVSYVAPEPTLDGVSFSAQPRTVEGGKSSTLHWSVINPKTTCSLKAEAVCPGGRSNCTQAQLSEEASVNATLGTNTDGNDPYNLPGYTRTVPMAVQKVAPYNNPTRNKALGKKTVPVNYTTDFVLDCGNSILKKVRVIVSDQNEG